MLIAVTPEVLQLCQFYAEQSALQNSASFPAETDRQLLLQKGKQLNLQVTILPENAGLLVVGNSDTDQEYWGEFSMYDVGRIATGAQTRIAVSTRGGGC